MEGCWRCDGNRIELRQERCSGEGAEWNGLVGDPLTIQYLTSGECLHSQPVYLC